eukprot:scaffold13986_cov107-Isochrysis_galbana.AAC.3
MARRERGFDGSTGGPAEDTMRGAFLERSGFTSPALAGIHLDEQLADVSSREHLHHGPAERFDAGFDLFGQENFLAEHEPEHVHNRKWDAA